MDFTIEFYESAAGNCPVREFLDDLKASDSDDFAAVVAGLAKLRNRHYHREPLSKVLAVDYLSLGTSGNSTPGCSGSSRNAPHRFASCDPK